MPQKIIILHDAESGREVRVNALTVKIESGVIADGWHECTSAAISEPSIPSLINRAKDMSWPSIRWTEDDGKEQFAKVVEQPEVIRDKKKNLI